jgi:hypothetical protein
MLGTHLLCALRLARRWWQLTQLRSLASPPFLAEGVPCGSIQHSLPRLSGRRAGVARLVPTPLPILSRALHADLGDPVSHELQSLSCPFQCLSYPVLHFQVYQNWNFEKNRGKIAFWDRFRLSLPGGISVIKNLLIPLLNYLGCILTPSDAVLDGVQESLDNFAIARNQVSKDRRYLKPADGGLGLSQAIHCRAVKNSLRGTAHI